MALRESVEFFIEGLGGEVGELDLVQSFFGNVRALLLGYEADEDRSNLGGMTWSEIRR